MGPPGGPSGAASADDDDNDRLSAMFADQTASTTDTQRASVQRWQANDDRFYQQVQAAVSGESGVSAGALAVANDLDSLAAPLADDVTVWRGLRNAAVSFQGVPLDELESVVGMPQEQQRFVATSLSRQVAEQEFTRPGRSPVLLRITARAGSPAVWIPPLGTPENAYQQELLFPPGVVLRILSIDRTYSVPIVDVEVSDSG